MKFKSIMLKNRSQTSEFTQADSIHTTFYRRQTSILTVSRSVVAQSRDQSWLRTWGSLGDRNALSLDCCGGYTGERICQNSSNCAPKIGASYYM